MRASAVLVLTLAGLVLAGCGAPVGPEGRNQLLQANQAYVRGDDNTAIAVSTTFLQQNEHSLEAAEGYYIRGLARERAKQTDAARSDFTSALKLSKRKDLTTRIHFELGNIAFDCGDQNTAQSEYAQVVAEGPKNQPPTDEAMYRLGHIMQCQGKWRQADEYFDKLMHNFPGSAPAKLAANRVRAVRWSIQVGAYRDDRSGRQLEASLRRDGFAPREDRELRNGQLLRLIRVGSYATYDAANADLPRAQQHSSDACIVAAR